MRNRFFAIAGLALLITTGLTAGVRAQTLPSFGAVPDSLLEMDQAEDRSHPWRFVTRQTLITFEEEESAIVAVLNYHSRVKVYDAGAKEASVVTIPYYFAEGIEEVRNIRAITHTPDGRQIPLQNEDIRTINVNSNYNVMEFGMPAVVDGSVLEYTWQIRRRYIQELPEVYLQQRVPVDHFRLSIRYPRYLRYRASVQNYEGAVEHRVEETDTSSVPRIFNLSRPEPLVTEYWEAHDVAAVPDENFISSVEDYRGQISLQMSEFGVPRQTLENSWDYVVADLRKNHDILAIISTYSRAEEKGGEIAAELSDPAAARDSIFRYLNDRVRYSGAPSSFSRQPDSAVLEGRTSDQAAINQTLIAMLKGAGIESYPLLISTRESGSVNRSFPSFYQFNAQLAWSVIGGEVTVMDASFPQSEPGLIPVQMYNENGLLLREEEYEWVPIQPDESTFSIAIRLEARLDRQGNLEGSVTAENAGYPKRQVRQQQEEGMPDEMIIRQALFDGYSEVEIGDASVGQADRYGQPAILSASFRLPGYAVSFSDGLEFRPLITGYLLSNPMEAGERDLPVTLDAPEQLDLVFEIGIPDGFAADPGRGSRTLELEGASFGEIYSAGDGRLRYEFHIDISRVHFRRDQFPQLIRLYERWVELSSNRWLISEEES